MEENHLHDQQQQSAESRVGSPAGAADGDDTSATRWNPTKEQIEMLERIYAKGLRTPSTEQIQKIADLLRTYDSIEGKNVFYWFQNHKARQRQRERQEAANRPAHPLSTQQPSTQQTSPPPILCHPMPLVAAGDDAAVLGSGSVDIRSACCPLPHFDIGSYHHYAGAGQATVHLPPPLQQQHHHHQDCRCPFVVIDHGGGDEQRGDGRQATLPLFPVHPTGVLDVDRQSGGGGSCLTSASVDSGSLEEGGLVVELGGGADGAGGANPSFFDFLGASPKSSY